MSGRTSVWLAGCAAIALLSISPELLAQSANQLQGSDYEIFSGDVNGDGMVDLLARARRKIAVIDVDDMVVPLALRPPVPSFVILSSGGSYSLSTTIPNDLLTNPAWRPGTHDMRFGDLLGTGLGSVVIEARNTGDPSFSVNTASGGVPQLIQTLNVASIGYDLGVAGTTTELADRNGDGRADLTVKLNNLVASVLFANANGIFVHDREGTIRAVWFGFKTFLDSGDAGSALLYIAEDSVPVYTGPLQQLGSNIRTISSTWTDIRLMTLSDTFASFSIADTSEGRRVIHVVTFIKERGRWFVSAL